MHIERKRADLKAIEEENSERTFDGSIQQIRDLQNGFP